MGGFRFADGTRPGDAPVAVFLPYPPVHFPVSGEWHIPQCRYHFVTTLEYHAQGRLARSPSRFATYRFGLVQNVVYDRVLIEYEGAAPMEHSFTRPVLDTGATGSNRPFVHDEVEARIGVPVIMFGEEEIFYDTVRMTPFDEVLYGPVGVGDLQDPWAAEGYAPRPDQRLRLSFVDQPYLILPHHFGGGRLARVELVTGFRFFVLAIHAASGRSEVLAHTPEFTLGAWMRPHPTPYLTLESAPQWMAYGLVGSHRRLYTSERALESAQRGAPQRLAPVPGSGGPAPVLTGTTANERGEAWLREQRLITSPPEPAEP